MHAKRRYPRYDLAHSAEFGGQVLSSPIKMRMASLSLGGCAFFGESPFGDAARAEEFWPPKEVHCQIFQQDPRTGFQIPKVIRGNLIYILPVNFISGEAYFYGVKFFDEEKEGISELLTLVESQAKEGRIHRIA
jgi:hypothetical protein